MFPKNKEVLERKAYFKVYYLASTLTHLLITVITPDFEAILENLGDVTSSQPTVRPCPIECKHT